MAGPTRAQAVAEGLQRSGVGVSLMKAVFVIARDQARRTGCAFVVVDAEPGAERYYERWGFGGTAGRGRRARREAGPRADVPGAGCDSQDRRSTARWVAPGITDPVGCVSPNTPISAFETNAVPVSEFHVSVAGSARQRSITLAIISKIEEPMCDSRRSFTRIECPRLACELPARVTKHGGGPRCRPTGETSSE